MQALAGDLIKTLWQRQDLKNNMHRATLKIVCLDIRVNFSHLTAFNSFNSHTSLQDLQQKCYKNDLMLLLEIHCF